MARFDWLMRLLGRGKAARREPEAGPAAPEVKVGDTFRARDDDEARMLIAMKCLESGRMITGSADWDDEGGTVRIDSVD